MKLGLLIPSLHVRKLGPQEMQQDAQGHAQLVKRMAGIQTKAALTAPVLALLLHLC